MQPALIKYSSCSAHGSLTPSPHGVRCQLVDEGASLYVGMPKGFHREGGNFVAPLVEGHYLPWSSAVLPLACLKRSSDRSFTISASSTQVCTRAKESAWVMSSNIYL